MASTTQTCSLAQPGVIPLGNHGINVLVGGYAGALSTSGSARLLMARIPATATRVQVTAHIAAGGAATQVLNFGLIPELAGTNTISASVFGTVNCTACAGMVMFMSPSVDVSTRWNDAVGEKYKTVFASLQSGTVTASFCLNYQITYSF